MDGRRPGELTVRAGTGHSEDNLGTEGAATAVRAALEQAEADSADVLFLFATYHYADEYESMLDIAVEMADTETVIGCSGVGVLSDEGEVERGPGITALAIVGDGLSATPFLVRGPGAAEEIAETIAADTKDGQIAILLPDIFNHDPTRLVSELRDLGCDLPIVGGAASGDPMEARTFQWCGNDLADDGVAGILLGGDLEARVGVAQGCQPFGQAYTVTKTDGHLIEELAFTPAVDALKEALATLPTADEDDAGPPVFIGLAMDEYALKRGRGDFLVRHMSLDPGTGALLVAEAVDVGQTVQFNVRTPEASQEDMRGMVERLAAESFDPTFGLYFNCMGRGLGLYGQPDHDRTVIRSGLGRVPFVGFFGNAELAPVGDRNFVHNYTGALALFH